MIEYNSRVWLRHVLDFHKIDTLRSLFPEIVIVAGYTAAIVLLERYWTEGWTDSELMQDLGSITQIHSLLGFIISLLLVFRTNSAYERWWEGRKHWGTLVNVSRNLANKLEAFLPADRHAERELFALRIGQFADVLCDHLRDLPGDVLLQQIQLDRPGWQHVPNRLAGEMQNRIKQLYAEGALTGDELIVLDRELGTFVDVLGACERIKKTPIPYSYSLFIKKFIVFYIATLPIGFAALFHFWAVPLIAFVFYVLVSLEIIAEEIEDPFGLDPNDLPTNKIAAAIGANVRETLLPSK